MDHLLERAIRIAAKEHKGQLDRFGKPYILHVMRVMTSGHDQEERILGALHDILERSDLTVEQLKEKGFPPRVLRALEHITRDPAETYEAYIDRVLEDGLAMRVKLHDLTDKMDLRQVQELSPADMKRYNRQLVAYHRVREAVEQGREKMPVPSKRTRPRTP